LLKEIRMTARNKNNEPVSRVAYAVSLALAGGYAPGVLAQTPTVGLEQVVVTARKREETLLDIPQEIQAISQQQLERANLDSVRRLR
jgi:outer membrane receptor protein involved in Fe transport